MVMTPKRPVVLRFRFGKGLVKARKESENTARFIAQEVAIAYSETTWEELKKNARIRIVEDVRAELVNLSRLFRRHIIGAAGTKTTPSGSLTTVAKGDGRPRAALSSLMPAWRERSDRYLQNKREALGNTRWFDNSGWPRNFSPPDNAGYLKSAFTPGIGRGSDIWEDMFGPIGVRIVRNNNPANPVTLNAGTLKRGHVRVQVATVYVTALGRIDFSMLKADASGNPGLTRLIESYDPELGHRLGRMRNGVYRPTLEPFLEFFLTRALPHAVDQRIKKGTFGSLFRR